MFSKKGINTHSKSLVHILKAIRPALKINKGNSKAVDYVSTYYFRHYAIGMEMWLQKKDINTDF